MALRWSLLLLRLKFLVNFKILTRLVAEGDRIFLGWGSCTKYCWAYWSVVNYYTETYTITQETPCPADNIVCCKDYLMIKGHCFRKLYCLTTIKNSKKMLKLYLFKI